MKFLFLFLSAINLTFFANIKLEDYNEKIHQGYEYYEVLIEESNQYYTLNITWGINKNNINYSLYFYSDKPQSLQIRVIRNNATYTLPSDTRGDVVVESFNVNNPRNLQIVIIDDEKHVYRNVSLPIAVGKEEFFEKADCLVGQNEGLKTSNLKQVRTPENFILLVIGLFIIIFISSLIILIIFIKKKGLFGNQHKNSQQDREWFYRQFQQREFSKPLEEEPKSLKELFEERIINVESTEEESKQVYKRSLRYEEELLKKFDIKKFLQDKGFITSYNLLSEEEKNLVMIELMILRDQKTISLEEYNQEVIELWKKS